MKPVGKLSTHTEVIMNVWQSPQISRYLDLQNNYVTGRIVNLKTQMAAYFLEKKRPEKKFLTTHPEKDIIIEYPFLIQKTPVHDS
ncbi:MAG: hypothetical protein IPJ69_01845 [Deltaproteobacteria bacterium]|nr:MAG: hypothetical protein IPJ69_01845 [Deltaproteobacteria bacterium]